MPSGMHPHVHVLSLAMQNRFHSNVWILIGHVFLFCITVFALVLHPHAKNAFKWPTETMVHEGVEFSARTL